MLVNLHNHKLFLSLSHELSDNVDHEFYIHINDMEYQCDFTRIFNFKRCKRHCHEIHVQQNTGQTGNDFLKK